MKESLRALLDDEARPPTLGERLDGDGRRIAARHRWTSAVGARLAPAIRRAEELQGLFSGRFERTEASDDGLVAVPTAMSPRIAGSAPPPSGPRPAPQVDGRSTQPEEDDGRPVPVDVRARLRDLAGPGADVLRVHDDAAADRTAVLHAADAVTLGADVFFRDGRLRPDEPAGFALLAHETTHVSAALEPGGAGGVPAGGPAGEEDLALDREWLAGRALRGRAGPDGPGHLRPGSQVPASVGRIAVPPPGRAVARPGPPRISPADDGRPGTSPPALGSAVPRAAAVDRPPDPQPPPFDVEVLRRELSRELMGELLSRLRSDAERGG